MSFDTNQDAYIMEKSIIIEYIINSDYDYLNKDLINPKDNSSDVFAYFTSRLIYSLNNYAKNNKMFYDKNKAILWKGLLMPYSSLLAYNRAVNKIIIFPTLISTSESKEVANLFSRRNGTKSETIFSVIFVININHKKNWISNGINLQNLSKYPDEKEILFQIFSFFYLKQVKIDINNKTADIYLETIGKKEILEKELKNGKTIIYDEKNNIMELI